MNVALTSFDKGNYLLIKSAGVLKDAEDLFRHAELVNNEVSKYNQTKILIDDRETRFPLNMIAYYEQVLFFSKTLPEEIRLLKIAIVLLPEFEEFGKFWETVSVNRGFRFFSFTDMEEAYRWLMEKAD